MLEELVIEPAVPDEEEREAASNHLSCTMSCSVKVAGEEPHDPEDARAPADIDHTPSGNSETQYGHPCHSRSSDSMDESRDPGHDSGSDSGLNPEKEYPRSG
jgi:hypothetical protein